MKQILILLAFICFMTGCDFTDDKLIVANLTHDSIAFIIPAEPNYFPSSYDSKDSTMNKQYNDGLLTTIAKYDPQHESFGGVHFLVGDSTKHIPSFNVKWEEIIDEAPDKKLTVKFVPAYVMTSGKYKWKDIYEQELFKEQTLTREELEKHNWTIEYKN